MENKTLKTPNNQPKKRDTMHILRKSRMDSRIVDPDHYKKGAFQPIDVVEDFLENESRFLTAKQKYLIGNAIKHLSQAGLTTPEDAITDLKEAENYIHRAITGEWKKDV